MFTWIQAFWRRRRTLARLSRFISGELSDDARREVARALDDPIVYAEYRRQREGSHAITSDLGGVGRADRTVFQRGWQNVTRALEHNNPTYRLSVRTADWRVRATAAGLVAALFIQMGLSAGRTSASNIPTPPVPKVAFYHGTPTSEILSDDMHGAATSVAIIAVTPTAPSN